MVSYVVYRALVVTLAIYIAFPQIVFWLPEHDVKIVISFKIITSGGYLKQMFIGITLVIYGYSCN